MKAVVLLSGGVDSTVALAHVIKSGHTVQAVSFNYGQTHARELDSATRIADHYGVGHRVIDLTGVLDVRSALTGNGPIPKTHAEAPDSTFVAGRNLVMLSIAIARAQDIGASAAVIGSNATDAAGYPDCRAEFISSLDEASRGSYGVSVWAPLLKMTKSDVRAYGHQLGAPLDLAWSCYRGGTVPCGRCGACTA